MKGALVRRWRTSRPLSYVTRSYLLAFQHSRPASGHARHPARNALAKASEMRTNRLAGLHAQAKLIHLFHQIALGPENPA